MGASASQKLQLAGTGTGRVGATATALPAQPAAKFVCIRAANGNAGDIFIGLSNVTASLGSSNSTTGFQLDAGQETPWIPLPDGGLVNVFAIASVADQDYTYLWTS